MNTEYNTSSSDALFPTLLDDSLTDSPNLDGEGGLLWNNVNTFAIPDDDESQQSYNNNNIESLSGLPSLRFKNQGMDQEDGYQDTQMKEDSTAFNISWGGNDRPPTEIHPEKQEEEPIKLSRPLPKPRGIRKLPEPEPAPDGTIDQDTLKRRKNTDAARRSRMKKFLKVDQLETKVSTLQAENAKLVLNNAVLESEKRSLHAKENEYKKRIKYLEDIMVSHGWDFDQKSPSLF